MNENVAKKQKQLSVSSTIIKNHLKEKAEVIPEVA